MVHACCLSWFHKYRKAPINTEAKGIDLNIMGDKSSKGTTHPKILFKNNIDITVEEDLDFGQRMHPIQAPSKDIPFTVQYGKEAKEK